MTGHPLTKSETIACKVERTLLKRIDRWGKQHKLRRSAAMRLLLEKAVHAEDILGEVSGRVASDSKSVNV